MCAMAPMADGPVCSAPDDGWAPNVSQSTAWTDGATPDNPWTVLE